MAIAGVTVLELKIDFSELEAAAREIKGLANEVKFAQARTINDAVFAAKDDLNVVWATNVNQRQVNFPRATWHVNKATKENLCAELVEQKSTILRAHDEGATISAQHSRALVVPTSDWRKDKMTNTHGLKASARLGALLARASARRTVRIKNGRVYVGKRGGLTLAFVLKAAITQRADVPLTQTFNTSVTRYVNHHLVDNLVRILRASHFLN